MKQFYEVPDDLAAEFCEYVQAAHGAKLRELALLIRDTGGPLHLMDGSAESLVPLWAWIVDLVDQQLEPVPRNRPGSAYSALGEILSDDASRATLLDELVGHYIFEMIHRVDSSASWTLYPHSRRGPENDQANECVISVGGTLRPIRAQIVGSIWGAMDGAEPFRRPAKPRTLMESFELEGIPVVSAGHSILEPYLGLEVVEPPIPDLSGVGGAVLQDEAEPEEESPPRYVVAIDEEWDDDLESVRELDAAAAAAVLSRHGFSTEHVLGSMPVQVADLMMSEAIFSVAGDWRVIPEDWDGRLLGLVFEPVLPSPTPTRADLWPTVQQIAAQLGASAFERDD